MNTEKPNNDDLDDRLLDHALRETLGGEAPPDLSQQILTAASQQTEKLSTLAIGDETMHGNHEKARKTRKFWMGLAVAASLLVAAGLLLPEFQSTREAAQSSKNFSRSVQESKPSSAEDAALDSESKTVLLDDIKEGEQSDSLMMGVTPRIIIQEEEEERLGFVQDDGDSHARLAADSSKSASGKKLPTPFYSMGRGKKKDLRSPGQTAARPPITYPDANLWQDLSQRRRKYDSVDLDEPLSESAPQTVAGNGSAPASPQGGVIELYNGGGIGVGAGVAPRQLGRVAGGRPLFLGDGWRVTEPASPNILQKFRNIREEGIGPDASGDQYTRIYENPFITAAGEKAVSTFSIDVDTASYANVRQFLMQSRRLPPPDAVRIEELINYFDYNYSGPTGEVPFAAHVETAGCPWHPEHRLVRIGIKGREIELSNRPQSNLVFLIDVSGSMNEPAKLPLLVKGLKMLTRKLNENDRVAIVVYASSEGMALESTRGDQQDTILAALEKLRAGGSTAGGAGIQLAYQIAEDHFIEGGTNRVILATDGDFNVGTTSTAELERLAESKAKETGVFLTVLGFGRGNLNDAMMEAISGKGNGNYHYIDNQTEARKVLVEEMTGTLLTIAKDVKIQVEFNPAQVAGYRLIGYENRMLRTEDFNDDKKDAGEIGAGHTVTALYEVVPAGKAVGGAGVDPLKYQTPSKPASQEATSSDDLLTLKIRYKKPDGDTSTKLEFPITDAGQPFAEATDDFKFAAAVASFGMLLRDSEHRGNASFDAVLEIAESVMGLHAAGGGGGRHPDPHGYRAEFLKLVRQAKEL